MELNFEGPEIQKCKKWNILLYFLLMKAKHLSQIRQKVHLKELFEFFLSENGMVHMIKNFKPFNRGIFVQK